MSTVTPHIDPAIEYLKGRLNGFQPKVALVLGSGLGMLANEIESPVKIPYGDIPQFPVSTVEGHSGQLVAGRLEGQYVIAMQGRFHFYEGYSLQEATFPIRVLHALGANTLIVTNAAGGVSERLQAGDLMLIKDHLNFSFRNPLIGKNLDDFGPRFVDTSAAYDTGLQQIAQQVASEMGLSLKEGVYQFSSGPTYETPAETRAARILGADAVGMSTVGEVLIAVHSGMRVLGISCISNMASGILDQSLSHDEVIETTDRIKGSFVGLIRGIVKQL